VARPRWALWEVDEEGSEYVEYPGGKDLYQLLDEVEWLFADADLHQGPEKARVVALGPRGGLLGALVSSPLDEPTIRFSVVVAERAQRQGVAKALVKWLVDNYGDEAVLEAWVINPIMLRILEPLDFETEGREWSEYEPFLSRQP